MRALFLTGIITASAIPAGAVTLAWDENPEPDIAGYRLYYGQTNAAPTMIDSGTNTMQSVSGLTTGQTYHFYVTAYNTSGLESDPSEGLSYTVSTQPAAPNAPSGLSGTALSTTQGRLQWIDNSNNETGFRVLRKTGVNGTYNSSVVSSNVTAYVDSGLAPGTQYFYKVHAFNSAGNSTDSAEISITTPNTPTPISATLAVHVTDDYTTSGQWKGKYGSDGYILRGDSANYPFYTGNPAASTSSTFWVQPTQTSGGLEPVVATQPMVCGWWSSTNMSFNIQFADNVPHRVAMYFLDYDRAGRQQTIEIYDAGNGALLGRRTISSFQNGVYSVWDLKGNVRIRVTRESGPTCVLNAFFFGPTPRPTVAAAATFVGANTTRGGVWKSNLGKDGQVLPYEVPAPPYYGFVTVSNANTSIVYPSTHTAALEHPRESGRVASTWYSTNSFSLDLTFKDSAEHRVNLYFADYDEGGRVQTIDVLDSQTGTVIDSVELSDFADGVWLEYRLKGRVLLRVTKETGASALLSGVFFDQ